MNCCLKMERNLNLSESGLTFDEKVLHRFYRYEFICEYLREKKNSGSYFARGKSALDFGFGDGVMLHYLQNEFGMNISGIEIDKERLVDAKDRFLGAKFYSDLSQVSDNFDIITAISILEHLDNFKSILDILWSKLNNDGLMFVIVPIQKSLYDDGHNWFFDFYDMHELGKIYTNDFRIFLINKYLRDAPAPDEFVLVLRKS